MEKAIIENFILAAFSGITVLMIFVFAHFFISKSRKLHKTNDGLHHAFEKNEAKLRKAAKDRALLAAALDFVAQGVVVTDNEDKIAFINKAAEEYLGIRREALLGSHIIHIDGASKADKLVVPLVSHHKSQYSMEVDVRRDFSAELNFAPLVSGRAEAGNIITIRDITKEKPETKPDLIAMAAHQLKSPLSATKWALASLLKSSLADDQRLAAEDAYNKNETMIQIVDNLMLEEKNAAPRREKVDLWQAVSSAIKQSDDAARRKNIKILFEKFPEKIPAIMADKNKMKIAVQNLVDNAIKYSREGAQVRIEAKAGAENLEFSVKDSGIGIPKSQQDKIFNKFFRTTNAVDSKNPGSGMGLFIVKNIIDEYKGKIWFESQENKGTTFHFTLPIEYSV